MLRKRGQLYVFTGPSGTGKGTLLSRVLQHDQNLFVSVSATTRMPRAGEKDGVHYYFLSREDFEEKIAQNAFLEYASYADNYYGTLEEPVNLQLDQGRDVILEIEVQGAMQIHEKRPDAVMIFVAPPSLEELDHRLHGRGTEDEEKIRKRMQIAEQELTCADRFDYLIVNDSLDQAVQQLQAIFLAERCKIRKS